MLDAATNRIDSKCGRVFQAASDTTQKFDPSRDLLCGELWLHDDLSYITSVVNGDAENITADIYHNPRNITPYYSLGKKTSSTFYWTYSNDYQDAISVTGRWAWMERADITAISRSAGGVITATVNAPKIGIGATAFVLGVADTGFNGAFTVTSNTGATLTWAQAGSADTDTTGVILYTPTDIVTACRRLAAWMYRQKDTQQSGTEQPLFSSDGTIVMPSSMPIDVMQLIYPYVRTM